METKTLHEWRVTRGFGVKELARIAGVSHTTIIRIEQQRSPGRAGTFRRLAEALKIEPLQIAEYRRLMGIAEDA